jgi:hypothetical protein
MWEKTTKVLMRDGKIGWLEQGGASPHTSWPTWTHGRTRLSRQVRDGRATKKSRPFLK